MNVSAENDPAQILVEGQLNIKLKLKRLMLSKLGVGLNLSASVLSLTTWADAKDVKQLYRNEFAQIGLDTAQGATAIVIPAFDDEGNPVPPANELYPVCFNDFRLYISQIDGIIQAIGSLDSAQIPDNADNLWNVRNVDANDRHLQSLANEYTAQVDAGAWPPVLRSSVDYVTLSNVHCDYLPEFIQMREFIANRNVELEDKNDFAAWMAISSLQPADPCLVSVTDFTNASNTLLDQITNLNQPRTDLVNRLFQAFGQETQEPDFSQNLEDQFQAAKAAGTLPPDNLLQDPTPATDPACADQTDPIGAAIGADAAVLKDEQDFLAFAPDFLCGGLSSQITELYDNNVNTADEANIQIGADLLNLLVITNDPNQDLASLSAQLRADWLAAALPLLDPGFDIPELAQSVPSDCLSNDDLTANVEYLTTLHTDTSSALSFQAYVNGIVNSACGTQHLTLLADLQAQIDASVGPKDALIAQLFADFGTADQDVELFGQFLEASYDLDVATGNFVGSSVLQDTKPTTPTDCAAAVSDLNDQIDDLANDLKEAVDLIEYLPQALCGDLDSQIQAVLDANADAINEPAGFTVVILNDLAMILKSDDESLVEFNERIFAEFEAAGVTPADPGFSQPTETFPASCPDPAAFDTLQALIDATTQALTYGEWLAARLDDACGSASADLASILNTVNNAAEFSEILMNGLVQDFFTDFGAQGQFLEDYLTELVAAYDAAVADGTFVRESDFQIEQPEVPDSCAFVTADVQAAIDAQIQIVNASSDFNLYAEITVCGALADEVDAIISENLDAVQQIGDRVAALLADLFLIEGEVGEDQAAFEIRLQNVRANDADAPVLSSGITTPTENVPGACVQGEYVDFTTLTDFIGIADDALSFEEWLATRMNTACGDGATELAAISADIQGQINDFTAQKAQCFDEFFTSFGGDDDTIESYSAALEAAYEYAKEAGEIPENDFNIELPDAPEACDAFVLSVEAEIADRSAALIEVQDCTDFVISTVCSALDQSVTDIIDANADQIQVIAGRIALVLNDILSIEGLEGETISDLDLRLRDEYSVDTTVASIDTGITLPSATVPPKCQFFTSYTQLEQLIEFIADTLAFEEWLKGRLEESCGTSADEYNTLISDLQAMIDESATEKTALTDGFFADFGGDATLNEYVAALDTLYQAAIQSGVIISSFDANLAFPDSPESCSSITNPLFLEVNFKIAELTDFKDCIAFIRNFVCSELDAAVFQIISDNSDQLIQKGQEVVDKLNILNPVLAEEGEDADAFALRLRNQYLADVEAGFPTAVADFSTPTETFPEACTDLASYDGLNGLIANVEDAFTFDAWLQELIDAESQESIQAHLEEIERITNEIDTAEAAQDVLIAQLFDSFDVDDMTLEAFEEYLQNEFTMLQMEGNLPEAPIEVETTIPAIPAGLEPLVEDLRNQIAGDADNLGDVLDFNQFAFDFVCEEAVDEIQVAIDAGEVDLTDAAVNLASVIDDIFLVEGTGETRMAFEAALRNEYALATADDTPAAIELPFDSVPEECVAGQAKLAQLTTLLQDLADIEAFEAWLMPRIDDAAVVFLSCEAAKMDLTDLVASEFSRWTDGINEKSQILTDMWHTDADPVDEPFLAFLSRTRATYDALKDADQVMIIDPELVIPEILNACPEDVHDQLSVAESFEAILEDCFSYLEWLKAQSGGFCEITQFEDVITDNQATSDEAAANLEHVLDNLFELKGEEDEEKDAFTARTREAFDMAGAETVDSEIEVPATSMACPSDAANAEAAAQAFVAELEDTLTYLEYVQAILDECCDAFEADFDGIRVLAEPRFNTVIVNRDAHLEALFVFKGIDAMEGVTEAETYEQFIVRYRTEYDATNPLVIPVFSLETFIQVPELCEDETAQELLDLVAGLNDNSAYLEWLEDQLQLCSDLVEMNIDMLIALNTPRVTASNLEKTILIDDLFTFAANDGETMEEFTARMFAEFDAHLDEQNWELVSTDIIIPDVPELADDDTEEARDELVELEAGLAYCLTLVEWLREGIYIPCKVLEDTFVDQLATEAPRLDDSIARHAALLASLKLLKDEDMMYTDEEFAAKYATLFQMSGQTTVPAGIDILPVPLVCQEETHEAEADLVAFIADLEAALTFEAWLDEQTQTCCQELGIEYVALRKMKEDQLDTLYESIDSLITDIELITDRTELTLRADFEAESEAGTVDEILDDTVVEDSPAECQGSTHDARQDVVDTCAELNVAMTFEGWLAEQLDSACVAAAWTLQDIIDTNTPRLGALDADKTALFATWAELKAEEGEDALAFEIRMSHNFNNAYNDESIEVHSAGLEIFAIPDSCRELTHIKLAEAQALSDDLDRYTTFCDWLLANVLAACDEQREEITAMLTENEPRLPQSITDQQAIIVELFNAKNEGFDDLDLFTEKKETDYAAAMTATVDTGITVPAVPEGCQDETKAAAADLQDFVGDLEAALTYQEYLQGLLQVCCEGVEADLNALRVVVETKTFECGTDTYGILVDLYGIEAGANESLEQYILRLRADYLDLLDAGTISVIPTGIEIPALSTHCDEDSQAALQALIDSEAELEDCISFMDWIAAELQRACLDCRQDFIDTIDDNIIILQAAELRIIDQIDNLYLLKDPEVDGEPEPIADFQARYFFEFAAAMIPGESTGIEIKVVAPDCPQEIHDLMNDLQDLSDQIGDAFAYENWVKMRVMECLIETENEFAQILVENLPLSTSAAEQVVMALNQLYPIKSLDDETPEEFAGRMKIKFDADVANGEVVLVETGIEIPDLPMNAPPSTTNAMNILIEFNTTFSYQLTWAQWLMDMLEMCCDEVADDYSATAESFVGTQDDSIARISEILTELFSLTGEQDEIINAFAVRMRAAYDAAEDTMVVESGIEVVDPPANCQQSTFDARDALQQFSDDLSNILSYQKWLEGEFAAACEALRVQLLGEADTLGLEIEAKDDVITETLANLMELIGEEGENFVDFTNRIRLEFEGDATVEAVDSGILSAEVPAGCSDATHEAGAVYTLVISDYNDCLTYQAWLDAKLAAECDIHAQSFQDLIDANTQDSRIVELANALYDLAAEEGEDFNTFLIRIANAFNDERTDPGVMEVPTGIEIETCPELCAQSTHDAKDALISFDISLQDALTFEKWLELQLMNAQDMNADDCDDLADQYGQVIEDNFFKIQESKDRQIAVKADAYLIKGEEGESFDDFVARFKAAFNEYVPIPIWDETIEFMELPDTCQQSTIDARASLQEFVDALSIELTYEEWLAGELKECCIHLVDELIAITDTDRVTECADNIANSLVEDLYSLRSMDFMSETLEEFVARISADYEADEDAETVDTGVERPIVPETCTELTPAIETANEAFNAFADDLQECANFEAWLAAELELACQVPTTDAQQSIDDNLARIELAKEEQLAILEPLLVFKGIAGEDLDQFGTRLRDVFDRFVSHRRNTGITVPFFPEGCTETAEVAAALEELIVEIANEETYRMWLQANLNACCDDRYEDILTLIDANIPTLSTFQATRDDLLMDIYDFANSGETFEEFIETIDNEYAALVESGEVPVGFSSIMELVPDAPEECRLNRPEGENAASAQDFLIEVAEGIEALESQILWLQPQLEAICAASEEELNALAATDLGTSEIQAQNAAKFASLAEMTADVHETIEEFIVRLSEALAAQVLDGTVTLAETGIDIPAAAASCPQSTQDATQAALDNVKALAIQHTLAPWLVDLIIAACEANTAEVAQIIQVNSAQLNQALLDTQSTLEYGFTILGEEGEDIQAFAQRMRESYDANGPAPGTADDLPVFAAVCNDDGTALAAAETVINQSLALQTLNQWFNDQFTEECMTIEMTIEAEIDAESLTNAEGGIQLLFADWYAAAAPEGQTLQEFIQEQYTIFALEEVETVDSGIVVPDYPEDCVEFTANIEATKLALIYYKADVEAIITLQEWAQPQLDTLTADAQAAADADAAAAAAAAAADEAQAAAEAIAAQMICDDASAEIDSQTFGLQMVVDEATALNAPKIEDFLVANDPANVENLDATTYLSTVIVPALPDAILSGEIVAAPSVTPIGDLPANCDQEAMTSFNDAADQLAAQETIAAYLDLKIAEICAIGSDMTVAIENETFASNAAVDAVLAENFDIVVGNGYADSYETYATAEFTAFSMDEFFESTFVGAVAATELPAGFCEQAQDDAIAANNAQIVVIDNLLAFADWLTINAPEVVEIVEDTVVEEDTVVPEDNPVVPEDGPVVPEDDPVVPEDDPVVPEDVPVVEEDPVTPEDPVDEECGIWSDIIGSITSSTIGDRDLMIAVLNGPNGDFYNAASTTNFFSTGTYQPPNTDIADAGLPPQPEGCDADGELEDAYIKALVESSFVDQFFNWCMSNQGDVSDGLCGVESVSVI